MVKIKEQMDVFLFNFRGAAAAAMLYIHLKFKLFYNRFFGPIFGQSDCSVIHLLFLISFYFMANLFIIKCTSFHAFDFEMCQNSLPLRSPFPQNPVI